jgi:hypothetical protein
LCLQAESSGLLKQAHNMARQAYIIVSDYQTVYLHARTGYRDVT